MTKTFPDYSDAYIEYCLDHSSDRIPSKLVLNENNEIVGCHQYYCTKAIVRGEEIETQWGHDTYLNKEYRSSFGLDFMLYTHSIKGFGVGLTGINEKIQKKLKKVFFKGCFNYYLINWKFLFSLIQRCFHKQPDIADINKINVDKTTFFRVFNAHDITVPNKGYWFKGYRDIDFIRDEDFLKERFFNNEVFDYFIFASLTTTNPCYFVVRKSSFRGYPALTLCDFRYSNDDSRLAKNILDAVLKLAIKSNFGIVFFVCGDVNLDCATKGRLCYKTKMDFVSGLKLSADMSFCLTGGDSDGDFQKK